MTVSVWGGRGGGGEDVQQGPQWIDIHVSWEYDFRVMTKVTYLPSADLTLSVSLPHL